MTIAQMWIKEGKVEGKIEGKVEDAHKMLEMGLSAELISEITGLSIEKITELKKELDR